MATDLAPKRPNIDALYKRLKPKIDALAPADAAALEAYRRKTNALGAPPQIRSEPSDDGETTLQVEGEDGSGLESLRLVAALGAPSFEALQEQLARIIAMSTKDGEIALERANFAIGAISEIAPRDALETMLATQMTATHLAAIRHLEMLSRVETIPQLEAQERAANKLLRTFTSQMEALRKYRSDGRQKVDVRHVHVSEGGQAIIGAVEAQGRRDDES